MAAPEMGRYLRQLVDNALEESQFESAISLLDQMRSPDHTPSPIHLLHVIFISLHATSHPCRLDDPTEPIIDEATLLQQSPRKMAKQSKAALLLSPDAVIAAHRLLHAFIRTNGAQALADALPYYPESKNVQPAYFEFLDCPIFNQAVAVKNARSVWDILKSGFTTKASRAVAAAQKGRVKPTRGSTLGRDASFNASFTDWSVEEDIKVMAEDSWHTLDWLVALFEADAQQSSPSKTSTLLLRQLPPPPINTNTRWDASEPLKVIFYAFKQNDKRRQRTGLRLLNLLIDLTQTRHLNLSSFASTALSQLAVAATPPHTHQAVLTDLLTRLSSSSPPVLAFKVTLLKKLLSLLEADEDSLGFGAQQQFGGDAQPPPVSGGSAALSEGGVSLSGAQQNGGVPSPVKPRIRPRPLAKKKLDADADASQSQPQDKDKEKEKGAAPTDASAAPAPPPPPLVQIQISLPPLSEIARLVRLAPLPVPSPPPTTSTSTAHAAPSTSTSTSTSESSSRPRQTRTSMRSAPVPVPVPASARESEEPQSPWSSPPALLLRVKFELVKAWIGVRKVRRSASVADGNDKDGEVKTKEDREREDRELKALIEDVFGSGKGGEGGEDEAHEKERAFYRDALGVFVGC